MSLGALGVNQSSGAGLNPVAPKPDDPESPSRPVPVKQNKAGSVIEVNYTDGAQFAELPHSKAQASPVIRDLLLRHLDDRIISLKSNAGDQKRSTS